uniref:Uncharacterized protein n=1 Tax=Vespula pensylvanica TaxID=30213 RepID=A0A834UHQ2_VESPE|nr:hypothetical protein H0235_001608 [Vespula pensylvanica]
MGMELEEYYATDETEGGIDSTGNECPSKILSGMQISSSFRSPSIYLQQHYAIGNVYRVTLDISRYNNGKRSTVLRRYYVARVRCTSDSCFPPVDFNITRFSFRFYSSTCPAESSRKLCPSPSSDLDHPIAQSLTYPTSNECLRVMLDTYFDRRFGNQ